MVLYRESKFVVWNSRIISHIQRDNVMKMISLAAVKKQLCSLSLYCLPFFLGVHAPLTHKSREGHKQNLFAICKNGRGEIKRRGLQKTVKLCSVSPLMHAVFNLLCASWRLGECVRARERIMLRNDRVAVTSKLSLEIQDIDFT